MNLGITKLLFAQDPSTQLDECQSFAVLSQRFGLPICIRHPDATEFSSSGVATHMSYCLWVSVDRVWMYAFYPSEPFLSHVAAVCLHTPTSTASIEASSPKLHKALGDMMKRVNSGIIDVGKSGELASRLILLLCKDALHMQLFDRPLLDLNKLDSFEDDLTFCSPVSLLDYLHLLFGENIYPSEAGMANKLKENFKNARINFSHWISMDVAIHPDDIQDWE